MWSCRMSHEMRTLFVSCFILHDVRSELRIQNRTANELNVTTPHDETSTDTSRKVAR